MEIRLLIKGGTIVDGTGQPAYRADLRVADGRIAEIGTDLSPTRGERIVDATGCHVAPGFIETHNHWDGGVWWNPNLEPLPGYGATTSINGNCGFSLAPAPQAEEDVSDVINIFNYFEDIPEEPMRSVVPWDWSKWSEYKASMQAKVKLPLHFAAFCGHIPLRLCAMGQDAWNRAATAQEIERMCELLEDALAAGAMGLSSNFLDYDKDERPLPSQQADDAEITALMRVLKRYPGTTFQVILDYFMRKTANVSLERFGQLAKAEGIRMQWAGMPTLEFMADQLPRAKELHEQFKAEGLDIYTAFNVISPTSVINFGRTLVFGQNGNPVWQELVNTPGWPAKAAMLSDPAWLDRARVSWDNQFSHSILHDPSANLLRESESGFGPTGVTLADYMEQTGIAHASDALAEWVLNNGQESTVLKKSWEKDEDVLNDLLVDTHSLANVSDAGAHGKLFCGAGYNVFLLTDYVRDRGIISIEQGVHMLTGRLADFFGLHDRGVLEVGKVADITVFDLNEIEMRPEKKIFDVWDGTGGRTYRYTRDPAPMRLTLVAGEPTFDQGEFTGRYPGQFIGPVAGEHEGNSEAVAIAAE
ncbi:amidohydrolase [Novosphingobium barchaimii LL02]|uniref:Amidohydrolase n=1 Tax=Novosphingobium barchaimii LL02 TaxID=1114963 RepID=A0A0J7XLU5_9SPHN|nr:amidohydrolase family protein [Novosphingobium barchaimii]KMS52063.1 amidohydrolase [Novosphingobium barchaimii LL02]